MIPLQQITLTVSASVCAALTEQLENNGALAVSYLDAENQPIYEPALNISAPPWKKIIIKALFSAPTDLNILAAHLCLSEFIIEQLPDKVWVRECMRDFQPMQFGKNLWVCPSWSAHQTLPPGLSSYSWIPAWLLAQVLTPPPGCVFLGSPNILKIS